MTKNLVTRLCGLGLGLGLSANVANASIPEDLQAIQKAVTTDPSVKFRTYGCHDGKVAVYSGKITIQTSDKFTSFAVKDGKKHIWMYDNNNDGQIDRTVITTGPLSSAQEGLLDQVGICGSKLGADDMEMMSSEMSHTFGKNSYNTRRVFSVDSKAGEIHGYDHGIGEHGIRGQASIDQLGRVYKSVIAKAKDILGI